MKEIKVQVNLEKSSFLKKDGKYEKESLKFLGLKLNIKERILSASTRKGASLQL
jgi:hypothetical protein